MGLAFENLVLMDGQTLALLAAIVAMFFFFGFVLGYNRGRRRRRWFP